MSFKAAFEPPCNYCGGNHSVAFCQHTPDPDDDEPDEPTDTESTPIMTDPEDPGEALEPHKPELGGESGNEG